MPRRRFPGLARIRFSSEPDDAVGENAGMASDWRAAQATSWDVQDATQDGAVDTGSSGAGRPGAQHLAAVGCRRDAPVVQPTQRGTKRLALDSCADSTSRSRALDAFIGSQYAVSGQASRGSLLKTWLDFSAALFGPHSASFPLTVAKLYAVGAMLRTGRYRSAANYFPAPRIGTWS